MEPAKDINTTQRPVRVLMTWHTSDEGQRRTIYERFTIHDPEVSGDADDTSSERLERTELVRLLKNTGVARQYASRWETQKPSLEEVRTLLAYRGYHTSLTDTSLIGGDEQLADFQGGRYCVVELDLSRSPVHATCFGVYTSIKAAHAAACVMAVKLWHGHGHRGGTLAMQQRRVIDSATQGGKKVPTGLATQSAVQGGYSFSAYTTPAEQDLVDDENNLDDAAVVIKCKNKYRRHFVPVYIQTPLPQKSVSSSSVAASKRTNRYSNQNGKRGRWEDSAGGGGHEMSASQERRANEQRRKEAYTKRHAHHKQS